MTDYWKPYQLFLLSELHTQSKAETFTVEGCNSLFRHFLARLRRKSKCYSKSMTMLLYSVTLLMLKRDGPHGLVQRAKIVLLAHADHKNTEISQQLSIQEENAGKWRKRWLSGTTQLVACEGKPNALRDAIEFLLADAPRPDIAPVFTSEQVCRIIALACEPPPAHWSHWTRAALVEEAVKRGIVEQISCTTIGRFLKSGTDKTASITLLAES